MISAKVVADSKNEFGDRITTMVVTMPRIILAEFNTHRMFSRNSASSRAIPFEKMVKSVEENPFIPIAWQKDHKGMQGIEYFTDENKEILFRRGEWLRAKESAVNCALRLHTQSVTKQLCNRLLEPFMWHTVIVTATEWENFFALRCPQYWNNTDDSIHRSKKDYLKRRRELRAPNNGDDIGHNEFTASDFPYNEPKEDEWFRLNKGQAEIHMMALAEAMWDARNESKPKELMAGMWHVPFENGDIDNIRSQEEALKIATACCARVSYTVMGEEDKPRDYKKDIELHDRLAKSGHWSPFEHCAQAMTSDQYINNRIHADYISKQISPDRSFDAHFDNGWSGNFKGFIQYRKTFKNENII